MKRKWKICIVILFLAATCGIFVFSYSQKRTEIVWYLTDPGYFGVDREDREPYQEVHAKRFELFNKRLKELGIPAKVVFKYVPSEYEAAEEEFINGSWYKNEILYSGEIIQTLLQNDAKADIAEMSFMEYDRFLPLDDYMKDERMKKAREAIPENIWKANRINGRTYQIPRGNVGVKETAYCFEKSFIERYEVPLEEEKIKKMTPEEVVRWLLPYFEESRVLDNRYCLTDAFSLDYSNYLIGKSMPVLEGTTNNLYLNLKEKKIEDSFSIEEIQNAFELYQYIYENNLDVHDSLGNVTAQPVFTLQNMPSIQELQGTEDEERILAVRLGNPYITRSYGNGVLKSSQNQELAVQVLAASVYDEELSNLMIYGVPEEDYRLVDGHAVYQNENSISCMGSYSPVGNNMIAYPNELEVLDKREKAEKILKEIPSMPYSNFTPDWNKDLLRKMSEIAAIYQETIHELQFSGVPDIKAYLYRQQEKLEDAGLEEVMSELQKQVDSWEE